ncbi:MAG: family 20 glycosylhydrolase, partial [Acidimicrobiia bacterium]|nr:family 20 glycosylhydrolase [Acidimicrobiia bacterium]
MIRLHSEAENIKVPQGKARDWPTPSQHVRMIHLDMGRKYWEPEYIADFIRQLSWLKMNTLFMHLQEDEAFRLHDPIKYCKTVDSKQICLAPPEGHYTKQTIQTFEQIATEHHINIIPALEIPSHA